MGRRQTLSPWSWGVPLLGKPNTWSGGREAYERERIPSLWGGVSILRFFCHMNLEFKTILEWATPSIAEELVHDFLQYCKKEYDKESTDEVSSLTFSTLMSSFESSKNWLESSFKWPVGYNLLVFLQIHIRKYDN